MIGIFKPYLTLYDFKLIFSVLNRKSIILIFAFYFYNVIQTDLFADFPNIIDNDILF